MATTKPIKVPAWNTSGANRTEPSAGEKSTGWIPNDQPPSDYFNWLQFYTGEWTQWIDERFFDGVSDEDLTIQPPASPVTDGGEIQVLARDATDGSGGDATLAAGDGAGTGTGKDGGSVAITGGDASPSGDGDGGLVTITGGAGQDGVADSGGIVTLRGGAGAGTDKDGGGARVSGGTCTGAGSSKIFLDAAEGAGSGTSPIAPVEYVRVDGSTKANRFKRQVVCEEGGVKGDLRTVPRASIPSTPVGAGDQFCQSDFNQQQIYDGSRWATLNRRHKSIVIAATADRLTAAGDFATTFTIPANSLRVGSTITVTAIALLSGSFSTVQQTVELKDGITPYRLRAAGSDFVITSLSSGGEWTTKATGQISVLGASGTMNTYGWVSLRDAGTQLINGSWGLPDESIDTTVPLTGTIGIAATSFGTYADLRSIIVDIES